MKVEKVGVFISFIVLISALNISLTLWPIEVKAATLFVGGGAPGNFTTIQAAIDFASPGDRIYVYNGTYQENLVIRKTLTLEGEDRRTTFVDGGGSGNVIDVEADWVNITGLTVMDGAGIAISNSENCYLADNNISDNEQGIALDRTNKSTFINNVMGNNSHVAMSIYSSDDNSVLGNEFYYNMGGVELRGSDGNIVDSNNFLDTGFGVYISSSERAVILNNSVTNGGVMIDAYDLKFWNTHTIDTANTINGKPLYYWKNATGGAIPEDAGEAIIANCSSVTIQNLDVGNGSYGVVVGFSHDNVIVNNKAGVSLTESDNNAISNNTLYAPLGFCVQNSDNNMIANNTASGCHGCIWIDISNNNTVVNNTLTPMLDFGIYTFGSGRLTIAENNIMGGTTGLMMSSVYQSEIINNTMNGQTEHGILVESSSSQNNISRNRIISCDDGIKVDFYSEFNSISHNSIISSGNRGVYVVESTNNTIAHNILLDNLDGIQFFEAEYNAVENNNITSNNRDGISFLYSDVNVIRNNSIEANSRFGVHLNWSFDNEIYHNNITNNSQQAFDDTDSNLWDNGYPSGGNNWSDYIGMDQFSGPDQDIPGSDGIGDTPYVIDAGSRDRYPFYVYTPFSLPSEPRSLSATPGNHQISLSWLPPLSDGGSPVTNYTIYRGIVSGGEVFFVGIGNVTGYTDTGLANGQEYFYQVSAVNIVGEGPKSNEASAIPFDPSSPPSPPRNLQATPGDRKVDLIWEPPLDDGGWPIINYRVYRGLTPAGISFLDEIGNVTNYTDTGLTNGQTYYYEVSALNWIGESIPRSNMASATPGAVPGPPVGLIAVPGDGEIAISWTEPADDGGFPVTNYRIYRGLMPGTDVFLVEIGNVTIHIDTGLLNDLTYYYKVSAVNPLGEGPLSNEANATPTAAMTEPTEPLNLVAFPGDGEVFLAWDPPWFDGNSPVLGYRIYRGTIPGGEVFLVDVGNVTVHNDPGLINGQTCYYMVSAVNAVGEGPLSNEANVTPSSTPGAPGSLMAELAGLNLENVKISWALSPDDGAGQGTVVGYSVYRNLTYVAEGIDYQLIATLPNGTTEFIDSLAGEGDPNNYFYKVCSVDLNTRTMCSSDQVGKFTRHLSRGTNLMSIPLIQQDGSISEVLKTVRWNKAWTYDPSSQTWRSNDRSKPYDGSLQALDHTMAFWIDVVEDSNLTIAGLVPFETTAYLHKGWNLVGFPSFKISYTVGDLKTETGATHVEGYDASSPPYFLKTLMDSDTLQAEHGYWVYVPADAVWVVSNR